MQEVVWWGCSIARAHPPLSFTQECFLGFLPCLEVCLGQSEEFHRDAWLFLYKWNKDIFERKRHHFWWLQPYLRILHQREINFFQNKEIPKRIFIQILFLHALILFHNSRIRLWWIQLSTSQGDWIQIFRLKPWERSLHKFGLLVAKMEPIVGWRDL